MPVSTLVSGRSGATEGARDGSRSAAPAAPDRKAPRSPGRWNRPVVAMVGGVVLLAAAAIVLVGAGPGRRPGRGLVPVAAAPATDPLAITVSARDVSVVTQVYEPGRESGWHAHAGIHAVAVLSGVLTVYDSQCQRQTFEPGRPYVGGQQPHLVRNETDAPVVMTVTYLNPSAPTTSSQHVAEPAGCRVG